MLFLTEEAAPLAIGDMLKAARLAKLAVAFWGAGAVERLGIGRDGSEAKIICNLQSGACNPLEIRKLLALEPRVKVLTNARLHAKVYWTEASAIVGSSNASANGLAVEGRTLDSWAEANLLVNDPSLLGEMSIWFDNLFNDSRAITELDLLKAEELWKKRRVVSAPGVKVEKGLLASFRTSPDHPLWERVKVTYWQDNVSDKALATLAMIQQEHPLAEELSVYEDWQEHLSEGDWVFDFFSEDSFASTFQGIWSILPSSPAAPKLSLTMKKKVFSPDAYGVVEVTQSDKDQLASAAKHFITRASDKRNAIVPLPHVVSHLDARVEKPKPLLRQFELAMRNIYFEAKAAGYTPSAFWNMLQSDGALETARRLALAPIASEGFTKLYLLKRLDLTVEALIIQEPWRRLFSPDVLLAAQDRLDKLQQE